MTKEQINQIMEFVKQNCDNGKSYMIAVMDQQGQVRATFCGSVIELCFMQRVLDNAVGNMVANPPQVPTPTKPTLSPVA